MRRFWTTAWSLSLAATTFPMIASAADYVPVGIRRPRGYSAPCCPTCPSDGMSYGVPQAAPQQPTMPGENPVEPMPGNNMPQPMTQQPNAQGDTADLPSFNNLALAEQGVGGGAGTMILGRADAINRFNLFDNMGAEPVSRVWFAFQAIDGLNTNVVGLPAIGRPNQDLYRFGVEYAFNECTSVAAQAAYNDPSGSTVLDESWSNPQFMVKRVLSRSDFRTISATLGLSVETGTDAGELNEQFSRLQPGILMYQDLDNGYFLHTGAELDIGLDTESTTSVDWVLSLGKWLYRHESMDGCNSCHCSHCSGGCGGCESNCCLPWIIGMTGQVELLGKHVTSDSTIRGGFFVDEPNLSPGPGNAAAFITVPYDIEEARNVIDMTIGTNILFKNDTALGLGYSFPVSDDEVRRGEFILSYNWFF
jgi:hypothetical protein